MDKIKIAIIAILLIAIGTCVKAEDWQHNYVNALRAFNLIDKSESDTLKLYEELEAIQASSTPETFQETKAKAIAFRQEHNLGWDTFKSVFQRLQKVHGREWSEGLAKAGVVVKQPEYVTPKQRYMNAITRCKAAERDIDDYNLSDERDNLKYEKLQQEKRAAYYELSIAKKNYNDQLKYWDSIGKEPPEHVKIQPEEWKLLKERY